MRFSLIKQKSRKRHGLAHCFVLMACFLGSGLFAQSTTYVSDPVYPEIIDIDLRTLSHAPAWKPGDPIKEIPKLRFGKDIDYQEPVNTKDPLVDKQFTHGSSSAGRAFGTPQLNMDGQGYTGVNPPDTVGDVGTQYYIQSINSGGGAVYTIYNKSDGSVAAGPFSMDDLGSGACGDGLGDPIILYDWMADRWFISEFSNSSNDLCIYISQTNDPITGGWFAYSFLNPNGFPDYPKYAVWPDGYYVTTNHGGPNTCSVFERDKMLLGQAATFQSRTDIPDLAGFGFQASTPADLDGFTAPPSGSPAYIMRHRDDEVHNTGNNDPNQDFIELWAYQTDWNTPANTSLTKLLDIPVAEFDSSLCGLSSFYCFPQSGSSTTLDPLREVIMWRLVYRNFGTHEALVGNYVVDIDGNDTGGIRWFELRKTGSGAWSLYQEGTHAPDDGLSRWMGAIGMDGKGNIALGYNVSSSSTYPSLAYAGRLNTDPLGTLPQADTTGEYTIVEGTSPNGSNRYGDYSSMNLDPSDDCTFWFTGEYNVASNWSTRIAKFTFESCLCTPLDAPTGVTATAAGNNQIDVSWDAVAGAESYSVYRAFGACPPDSWVLLQDGVTGTSYADTAASGGVTYSYTVTSYDLEEDCESTKDDCSSAQTTGSCMLLPDFSGLAEVVNPQTANCSLILNWNAGQSSCSGTLTYNVYRGTTEDFTPDASSLIASCIDATTYTDNDVESYQMYYYIVRAEDSTGDGSGPCNNGNMELNTVVRSGSPSGPDTIFFEDNLESGDANWVMNTLTGDQTNQWLVNDDEPNAYSPTHVLFVPNVYSTQDQTVQLANPVNIPAGSPARLSFYNHYNTESNYDGGVLEYSVNGGTDWYDILAGDGNNIPANADRFISGEYNDSSLSGSGPLADRSAWTGDSGGFIETAVDLSDLTGVDLLLRWRMGSDSSASRTGWWIDDIKIFYGNSCEANSCASYAVTVSDDTIVCTGGSTELNCDVTNSTGTVTYLWTPATGLSSATAQNPVASPAVTTTYTVLATDDSSCEASGSVTVTVFNNTGTEQEHLPEWLSVDSAFDVNGNGILEILDLIDLINSCNM
ncbi:MAG: hypothetical protein CR997_01410 [Acidobacteria bacterium]|nr:MAG: hypothetical protein CR997_01410 [Acidobacteriota bacterium]